MTDEDSKLVEDFESKIRKLMDLYEVLKDKNKELIALLETEKRENEQLRKDLANLTESYQTLKQSKVLEVSGQDIDDTKQRINRLVREIDHCIDLLNV
jgi:predicted RNase H-like nuclease (RuvC/YqgF family)